MCGIALLLQRSQPGLPSDVEQGWLAALRAAIHPRGPDVQAEQELRLGDWRVRMLGAVLHMRGAEPRVQPAVDAVGNVLLWNGEVFGGRLGASECATPGPEENDTDAVLAALGGADADGLADPDAVGRHCRATLLELAGPWALVYLHRVSSTLHFGRDRLGRRSLCLLEDPGGQWLVVASTTAALPASLLRPGDAPPQWREVTVEGLWQLDLGTGTASSSLSLRPIPWTPTAPSIPFPTTSPPESLEAAAALLLAALDAAVRRRVASVPPPPPPQDADEDRESFDGARIGVLFSGGLDCQVLAALAHRHAPPGEPVDLVNVCFDAANGHRSPDRLGALAGVAELRRACPGREWRLVCVDVPYAEVCGVEARVKRLIHPCATPMDFNIAVSFYAAARARGRLVPPSIVAEGVEGAGAASGLLRYGQAEEAGAAAAAAASAVAAAVEEESHGPCGNWECRRVGKPGCRRRLCGHCCTRVQRRALEALEGEEEEAEGRAARAAAILCQGHKLGKKYLPPWLTQHKQHKQQQHAPAATLPPNPAVAATATATGIPYRSRARALLLGIGADEQLAGYGRHRSTFARGGFEALERELAFDLDRLWTRNLGRDDRCVAEHGREGRFPYLDEDVMALLRALPTQLKFNLEEPRGIGDKKVLRHIAGALLGLEGAARLVKRAIQFGSRIAREGNIHNFGSHRSGKQTRWARKPSGADWGVPAAVASAVEGEEED